jgi:hypothetical protein
MSILTRRPCLALFALVVLCSLRAAALGGQDGDVTGTWDLSVSSESGSGDAVLVLKQEGQDVSGTYKGRMGEAPVSGSVNGNRIRFMVRLHFRDMSFAVSYSGTVQGDRMEGSVDFGDGRTGTWKAVRRPPEKAAGL